jgi:hypothetical protein
MSNKENVKGFEFLEISSKASNKLIWSMKLNIYERIEHFESRYTLTFSPNTLDLDDEISGAKKRLGQLEADVQMQINEEVKEETLAEARKEILRLEVAREKLIEKFPEFEVQAALMETKYKGWHTVIVFALKEEDVPEISKRRAEMSQHLVELSEPKDEEVAGAEETVPETRGTREVSKPITEDNE